MRPLSSLRLWPVSQPRRVITARKGWAARTLTGVLLLALISALVLPLPGGLAPLAAAPASGVGGIARGDFVICTAAGTQVLHTSEAAAGTSLPDDGALPAHGGLHQHCLFCVAPVGLAAPAGIRITVVAPDVVLFAPTTETRPGTVIRVRHRSRAPPAVTTPLRA